MQTTVTIIQSVAWPATLLISLLILRQPLARLLPRLKSGEVMGARVEFSLEVDRGTAARLVDGEVLRFAPERPPNLSTGSVLPEDAAESTRRAVEALQQGYVYAIENLRTAIDITSSNPSLAAMLTMRFAHGELLCSLTRSAARGDYKVTTSLGTTEEVAERLKGLTPLTDYALDQIKNAAATARKLSNGDATIDSKSANVLVMFVARSIAPLRAFDLLDGELKELI